MKCKSYGAHFKDFNSIYHRNYVLYHNIRKYAILYVPYTIT